MNAVGRFRGVWRVLPTCLLAAFLLSLIVPAPVAHALLDDQTQDSTPSGATGAKPSGGTMGVYITSLRDFDVAGDSFGADYWLWSVHSPANNPLDDVEFVNAKQIEMRLDQTAERGKEAWSRQKVRATVLHDWDLSNFPFDRQTLQIDLRFADSSGLTYRPDETESGYGQDIAPDGWRVTDFEIDEHTEEYATTFGDPEGSGGSRQEHVRVLLELERENSTVFYKMIAGVYAAIALGCLTFLMKPDQPTVFTGRITLLAAALFAVVVNLQVSDATLGSLDKLGLVQKIHILAMAYVFIAALLAIFSRQAYEAGDKERARRRDLIGLCVFSVSFVVLNFALIATAAAAG